MDDSAQAWSKVGERFGSLGQKLKHHYSKAAAASGDAAPDEAAVRQALDTLASALQQTVDSLGGAVKDPAVRDDLRGAFNAMGEALNVTFSDVGEVVGEKVKDTLGRKDAPPSSS